MGVAQTPASPQPATKAGLTIDVTSRIVVLDVVVTDKQGKPVDNLDRDAFEIFEDKVPQTIRSFEHEHSVASPTNLPIHTTAELDKLEPKAPVSIIVLDEINTRFEDEAFARYSLKRYLNTQGDTLLQPTMLVAVNQKRFMVLHDYTTSKKEVLDSLEHHFAVYPWDSQIGGFKMGQFNAAIASLMEVAQATAGHPGHKNMIWIGRGFPSIDAQAVAEMSPELYAALQSTIETCANTLRDARVTLYTVDPVGISTYDTTTSTSADDLGEMGDADPFGGSVDFNAMAKATGGKSLFGRNDVDNLIENSVQAGTDFYTLSYVPTSPAETAKPFRNIRVAMKDPNLRATSRKGYYIQPTAAPPADNANGKPSMRLIFDLSVASESMMVYDGVPFRIVRDANASDTFRIVLPSTAIPWQSTEQGKVSADITVLVESFDRKGKLLSRIANSYNQEIAANAAGTAPAAGSINLPAIIPTAAPAARIRFVVRSNANGKLGADNFFLVDRKTLADPTTGTTTKH
jgi:VWFA-related protein